MENIYRPELTSNKEGYKATVKFYKKIITNSVYGILKTEHFYFSDDFYRKEEIRKKRELRIEKLNK